MQCQTTFWINHSLTAALKGAQLKIQLPFTLSKLNENVTSLVAPNVFIQSLSRATEHKFAGLAFKTVAAALTTSTRLTADSYAVGAGWSGGQLHRAGRAARCMPIGADLSLNRAPAKLETTV